MTDRYPSTSPSKRPKFKIVQALALSDDEDEAYTEEELEEREEAARASALLYGDYQKDEAKRLSSDMRTVFEGTTKWSSEFPGEFKLTQTKKTQQPDGSWVKETTRTSIPRTPERPTRVPPPPPGPSSRVPFHGDAEFGQDSSDSVLRASDALGRKRTSPRRRRHGEKSPEYNRRLARQRKPVPISNRVIKSTLNRRPSTPSPTSPPRRKRSASSAEKRKGVVAAKKGGV